MLMLLICYLQVKFVVMDEFSMVSSNQLYQICRKLQVLISFIESCCEVIVNLPRS